MSTNEKKYVIDGMWRSFSAKNVHPGAKFLFLRERIYATTVPVIQKSPIW